MDYFLLRILSIIPRKSETTILGWLGIIVREGLFVCQRVRRAGWSASFVGVLLYYFFLSFLLRINLQFAARKCKENPTSFCCHFFVFARFYFFLSVCV